MNITLFGGELLGWFKFEDIYDFSQNIDSAVYAFGVFNRVPSKEQLPITMKNVYYVGQTGGQEKTIDLKNRDKDRAYLRSSFHARMKDHVSNINGKVRLIRESMSPTETLCVYIIKPKVYMDEESIKDWLLASESELISCYRSIFKHPPIYNYAHHSNRSRTDENSVSQKKIAEMKERSIENFLV